MQVLFDKIEDENNDGSEFLAEGTGTAYYARIAQSPYCSEEFIVQDTCSRFVPFRTDAIEGLITALEAFRDLLLDKEYLEDQIEINQQELDELESYEVELDQ